MESIHFNAFLSYAREDEDFARRLERMLERFRIPAAYRSGRARLNVYRDISDIHVGELSDSLKDGLDRSDYLIVICSPNSRDSFWVGQEISYFIDRKGKDRVVPILLAGTPNSTFHPKLLEYFENPSAADFRPLGGWNLLRTAERRREALFQVIAKLLDASKTEELVGRARRRFRFQVSVVGLIFAAMMVAAVAYRIDQIPRAGISIPRGLFEPGRIRYAEEHIASMRAGLLESIPSRDSSKRLLIATWNVRELGGRARGRFQRETEGLTYIAEILSRFDIVAIQELQENLDPFQKVLDVLGRHYDVIMTGVVEGRRGNGERLAFVFDRRKIRPVGETDEIVVSPSRTSSTGIETTVQPSRTPYLAIFEWSGKRIALCNVHIWYGTAGSSEERTLEIEQVAETLETRKKAGRISADLLVLLGDLNIMSADDPHLKTLQSHGFTLPPSLAAEPSSVTGSKPYDQIAIMWGDDTSLVLGRNGVLDFRPFLYRPEDLGRYWPEIAEQAEMSPEKDLNEQSRERLYRQFRLIQVSDHLPKWIELTLRTR